MAMQNKTTLYKLTFPDGKVYIGCTSNIKQRWAGNGAKYKGMSVYGAIQKFGWTNINREVIAVLPDSTKNDEAIRSIEKELIKAYSGRSYNCISDPEFHEENPSWAKKNKGPSVFWTAFGKTRPAKDWCEEFHKQPDQVRARMKNHGLTIEQALTFPPIPMTHRKKGQAVEYWKSLGLFDAGTESGAIVVSVESEQPD